MKSMGILDTSVGFENVKTSISESLEKYLLVYCLHIFNLWIDIIDKQLILTKC